MPIILKSLQVGISSRELRCSSYEPPADAEMCFAVVQCFGLMLCWRPSEHVRQMDGVAAIKGTEATEHLQKLAEDPNLRCCFERIAYITFMVPIPYYNPIGPMFFAQGP